MTNLTTEQMHNILTKEYGDADWNRLLSSLFGVLTNHEINDVQAKEIIRQLGINTLIQSVNVSYTVQNTNVDNNEIKELFIDPVRDLEVNILNTGIYNINYNFLRNKLDSSVFSQYYISEISNDRTELRLDTTNLTNDEIKISFDNFSIDFNNSPVFNGFYLNFNSNNLLLATNIALDTTDGKNTILIKLYEPLPPTYDIKTQLWVVEKVSDPLAYQVPYCRQNSTCQL
jgi:hypothetical protein